MEKHRPSDIESLEDKANIILAGQFDMLQKVESMHNPLAAAISGEQVSEFPNQVNYHYPFPLEEDKRRVLLDAYATAHEELTYRPGVSHRFVTAAERLRRSLEVRIDMLRHNTDPLRPINHTDISPPDTALQDFTGHGLFRFLQPDDFEASSMRARSWNEWVDTAIEYMEEGIARGEAQPSAIAKATARRLIGIVSDDQLLQKLMKPAYSSPIEIEADTLGLAVSHKRLPLKSYQGYKQSMQQVIGGYQKLRSYVTDRYVPASRSDDTPGLYHVDNGQEQYQRILRYWMGQSVRADDILEYAQAQYVESAAKLTQIASRFGLPDAGSVIRMLKHDKQYHTFQTHDQIKAAYSLVVDQQWDSLPILFRYWDPDSKPDIYVTTAVSKGAEIAKHEVPSADGRRKGRIFITVADPEEYSTTNMRRIALHEGVPGHHLQMTLQSEGAVHPYMLDSVRHPAYRESWAVYAQSIGDEMTLPITDADRASVLANDLVIARAVILDIGLHDRGWSIERAKLERRAMHGTEGKDVEHYDILRYGAWPGQAVNYLFSNIFRGLRQQAHQELGDTFDVRTFHNVVLEAGEMPFDMLQQHVSTWISSVQNGTWQEPPHWPDKNAHW